MIKGLSNEQRAQAVRDIQAGKKTTASMVALNELGLMHEAGGISIWDDVSKTSIGVSIEKINVEKNLIILEKNGDDLNNYSYLEYEYLKKKGLITNKEYNEITGYIQSEIAEQSANEENYYAELSRNEKSSQGGSGKTGSEKPPAETTQTGKPEIKPYIKDWYIH
jgi:hypothetical protein